MACDECAVDGCSAADKNAYIQGILNIVPQESRVPFTACASFETDLERRSQRLLHQGSDRMRYKMTGVILFAFDCFSGFFCCVRFKMYGQEDVECRE